MSTIDLHVQAQQLQLAYHGTTAEVGRAIEQDGFLRSRGAKSGNWETGPFGGNPGNPDWVYVIKDREMALGYMKEVCRSAGVDQGALVTVQVDTAEAYPDEDEIFDWLYNLSPSPLVDKLWRLYAEYMESPSVEALKKYLDEEEPYATNDAELAYDMVALSEKLMGSITEAELQELRGQQNSMAFDKPIPVVSVEYFA